MRRVVLSKRLRMLADMVTVGSRVADVGCDHGFLSIWLVQAGVSPRVLAMDVRKGPLAAAREHVEAYGLGDYIETRLSDGLKSFEAGEAETLVCAGMGGRLMERILTESMDKAKRFTELILQPQSELWEFRMFLRREGFEVLQEEAVCEDGKFYFAMKVSFEKEACFEKETCFEKKADFRAACDGGGDDKEAKAAFRDEDNAVSRERRVCDRFGEKLLLRKDPVLRQYLQWRRKGLTQLADTLGAADIPEVVDTLKGADVSEKGYAGSERQRMRLQEILMELADVEYALKRMQ